MLRTTQRITTLAIATTLLALATTTTATARIFSSAEPSFRVTWSSLEFTGAATIRCRVTLEGSFHSRTIPKIRGLLVGAISRAIIAHPCTGGEAWADNGAETQPLGRAPNRLPFHLSYESFTGTLPSITTIGGLISRFSFVVESTVLGFNCRGRYGRAEDNISATGIRSGGGGITSIEPVEGANRASLVDQLGGARVCGATAAFRRNSGPVTRLSDGATLTITLI